MQTQRQEHPSTTTQSSTMEKMIPKYCTAVQVALLNNSNLVLSLSFAEPNQPSVLIERVVIDREHADNLANVLKSAVAEAQEKNISSAG